MTSNWRQDLYAAVRSAKIKVVGQDDVKNEAQARLAVAVLRAYGDSSAGFVYMEPCTARSTKRPPDVLLCQPDVGILVFEVKGHEIESIQSMEAGTLFVREGGWNRPINPLRQAEESMFDIEDAVKRVIREKRNLPLFSFIVAFPNISESDWSARGFDQCLPGKQLLFREQVDAPARLKQRVHSLVREGLQESHKERPLSVEQIKAVRQVFGDSAVINEKRTPRAWVERRKLGAYLDEMVALDKYLSAEQQELSRLNVEGHPRLIRGVAGSGKTVVLANLVARLVARRSSEAPDLFNSSPDSLRVAVVCFNRSLVHFIRRKVKDSYRQQTLEDLPSDTVTITHLNGLMSELSRQGIWEYITVREVPNPADRASRYLTELSNFAAGNQDWYEAILFDAIFVDEGQDFEPEEYQLLLQLVRPDPKTGERPVIIFYDDAQNLYARPRPNWKQLGIDVQRGDRARVMKECFRNTREIVELAFNVLLGSQAPADARVRTRTYADVNYLKQWGLVEEVGDHYRVRFAERTFSKPIVRQFTCRTAERQWVVEEVARLVEDEEVRPEDILIVFHRREDFEVLPELLAARLNSSAVKGFIRPYAQNPDQDDYIFREGYLTISTTYGAKGYDCQIVFVVGADLFTTDNEGRASFYVGATRAKQLLYITGLTSSGSLLQEADAVNAVV